MYKVTRRTKDINKYTIEVDEAGLLEMQQALQIMAGTMEEMVRDCKEREARGEGYDPKRPVGPKYEADEDLMFLYGRLADINSFIFQSKFLYEHTDHKEA